MTCDDCKFYYLDDDSKPECSVYPLIFGSAEPVVAAKCPSFDMQMKAYRPSIGVEDYSSMWRK
jgi:hypothetical protein